MLQRMVGRKVAERMMGRQAAQEMMGRQMIRWHRRRGLLRDGATGEAHGKRGRDDEDLDHGLDWMPITPETGSLFHADSPMASGLSRLRCGRELGDQLFGGCVYASGSRHGF
jgi:hypothetical protein